MKRFGMAKVFPLVLACMVALCALPAGTVASGMDFPQKAVIAEALPTGRIALRAAPNERADSLGEYRTGAQVTVLDSDGTWCLVRTGWSDETTAGTAEGYIRWPFLWFQEYTQDMYVAAYSGRCCLLPGERMLPVLAAPEEGAELLHALGERDNLEVMGDVGEDWYHIAYFYGGNGPVYGYVRRDQVVVRAREWDGGRQALVDNPEGDTLPMYLEPDARSRVLGEYYNAVEVYTANPEGEWTFVTLAGTGGAATEGYMRTDRLRFETGGVDVAVAYAELRGDDLIQVYSGPEEDSPVLGPLAEGALVRMMGESGEWRAISTDNIYGYVKADQLEATGRNYTYMILKPDAGVAFAVAKVPSSSDPAYMYPYCEEDPEAFSRMDLPAGSGLLVLRELGEWTQAKWSHMPDAFIPSRQIEVYRMPALFGLAEAIAPVGTGEYAVGGEVPSDAYCLRVPEGGQGTLTITWPDGDTRIHQPAPGSPYNLYLPEGVTIALEGDCSLEPVDETWLRDDQTGDYPDDCTGRYLAGLNLEAGSHMIEPVPGTEESYYLLCRLPQEAGEEREPKRVEVVAGKETIIELEQGDFLEVYGARIWTNG